MRRLLFLFALLSAVAGAELKTVPYHNERYGYSLDVPASFQAREAPANQDGRTFEEGPAVLLVWGSNNVTSQSLEQARGETEAAAREEGPLGYHAAGKNWFVLSWVNGDRIVYQKTFLGEGCSQSFRLSYPLARKAEFDPVVKRLEASFTPGDLSRAH